MSKTLFTSESVTKGHPDKICDRISDAILDAMLEQDPQSRVACETFCTTGQVHVMGEITSNAQVDIPAIIRKTVCSIGYDSGEKDDKVLLERCLNKMFGYYKMLERKHPFKLFMGITGSGKSTAIAKVATQAKFKKISCCIVSTDNIRAGANNQLQAFAEILETPFSCAKDAQSLYEKAASSAERYELVLVDTPGINPFEEKEVSLISPLVRALKADVIMTMDAGRNSYDSVEIAEIFSKLGARYLLPTRMDLTRRIGGIISVAESTGMALGAAGVSSSIVQGIAKIDAKSLARLLLV